VLGAGPPIDVETIRRLDHSVIRLTGYLKWCDHLGWGVFTAILGILAIISYWTHRPVVSRFITAKKWVGLLVTWLTVVTSFTWAGEALVFGPAADRVFAHYHLSIDRSRERELDAIRGYLATRAERQAISELSPDDLNKLQILCSTRGLRGGTGRGKVKDTESPPERRSGPSRGADTAPRLEAERRKQFARERRAEEAKNEQERAFDEVLKNTTEHWEEGPRAVLKQFLLDFVPEGGLKRIADDSLDHVFDLGSERLIDPLLEKFSSQIKGRLLVEMDENPRAPAWPAKKAAPKAARHELSSSVRRFNEQEFGETSKNRSEGDEIEDIRAEKIPKLRAE